MRPSHRGMVVWFSGLSASGKTTLGRALERGLLDRGGRAFVLDGDQLRAGLSRGLGFGSTDRAEHIRRVAEVSRLFGQAGVIAIVTCISPSRVDRRLARDIVQQGQPHIPFIEVFLSTSLEVCESRDPKGLYARARAGAIEHFTGISAPFEPPEHPEIVLDTGILDVRDALGQLLPTVTRACGLEVRPHVLSQAVAR
jgi:adenylyl-sulfate kinase